LYDIQPGNGAGKFLQPRSPHGADGIMRNLQVLRTNVLHCDGSGFVVLYSL